jgi:hypothetical protein
MFSFLTSGKYIRLKTIHYMFDASTPSTDMDTTHNSTLVDIPLTPPSSPDLSPRQSVLLKPPPIWRLSSLQSLLEYNETLKQEKEAGTSITTSEVTQSEDASNITHEPRFRSSTAEWAFILSMALTQLIAVRASLVITSWQVLIQFRNT